MSILTRPFLPAICLIVFICGSLQADEKKSFYDPIDRDIEGWTVRVDPRLLTDEHKEVGEQAFKALANHLQRIKYTMADEALTKLQGMAIWIELDNPHVGGMQYHPGEKWLIDQGMNPRLVKHVHVPTAKELYNPRTWAKHQYVILHELSHAFHDQVLGFDEAEIVAAYKDMKERGIYDKVLLFNGATVKHYALTTPMEYFAESTEAYFGMNDFYPFVRAELKQHDPKMFELLEKFWGRLR